LQLANERLEQTLLPVPLAQLTPDRADREGSKTSIDQGPFDRHPASAARSRTIR